jgi:hypothetical protein
MGYIRRFDSAPQPPGSNPDEVVLWLGPVAINADVPILSEPEEELPINANPFSESLTTDQSANSDVVANQ